jgi:hypothetical protein
LLLASQKRTAGGSRKCIFIKGIMNVNLVVAVFEEKAGQHNGMAC